MTEAEWLACTDPGPMLGFLGDRISDRKLRLFGVACWRRQWHLLAPGDLGRDYVELAERYADGAADRAALERAYEAATPVSVQITLAPGTPPPDRPIVLSYAYAVCTPPEPCCSLCGAPMVLRQTPRGPVCACSSYPVCGRIYPALESTAVHAARIVAQYAGPSESAASQMAYQSERREQGHLLRDVIGNPYRLVEVDPSWLAWNGGVLVAMARVIYEERLFGELPVLADALEEAGCTNAEILNHCRQPGEHVRGCWVLDLLLGKG